MRLESEFDWFREPVVTANRLWLERHAHPRIFDEALGVGSTTATPFDGIQLTSPHAIRIHRQPKQLAPKKIRGKYILGFCLREIRIDEIQDILAIHAEDAAGASAISVDAKRGDACHHVGITQKVRPARIAKAGSAGGVVVRQQE